MTPKSCVAGAGCDTGQALSLDCMHTCVTDTRKAESLREIMARELTGSVMWRESDVDEGLSADMCAQG